MKPTNAPPRPAKFCYVNNIIIAALNSTEPSRLALDQVLIIKIQKKNF